MSFNLLQKSLNLLKKSWHIPISENVTKKRNSLNLKQNSVPSSIKDLEKAGLTVRKINETGSANHFMI